MFCGLRWRRAQRRARPSLPDRTPFMCISPAHLCRVGLSAHSSVLASRPPLPSMESLNDNIQRPCDCPSPARHPWVKPLQEYMVTEHHVLRVFYTSTLCRPIDDGPPPALKSPFSSLHSASDDVHHTLLSTPSSPPSQLLRRCGALVLALHHTHGALLGPPPVARWCHATGKAGAETPAVTAIPFGSLGRPWPGDGCRGRRRQQRRRRHR